MVDEGGTGAHEHEIVSNTRGQCSVVRVGYPVPAGWEPTGLRGERWRCLEWIAEGAHEPGSVEDAPWWRDRLACRPPVIDVPTDHPRSARGPADRGEITQALDADLVAGAAALTEHEGLRPETLWYALVHVLLSRYSGETDVTLTFTQTTVDGQGWVLAQRVDLSDEPDTRALLHRVAAEVSAAQAHPRVRLGTITVGEPIQFALAVEERVAAPGDAELVFSFTGTTMTVDFDRALFEPDTVAGLIRHGKHLVRRMIAAPTEPVTALAMFAAAEARAIAAAGVGPPATDGVTIPESIIATARSHPNRCALVFGDTQVTYGELDRSSAAVAAGLRALGVGPEDIVAVSAARSADLVVTLVGILRARAAYLPLDPEHPRRRVERMMRDAAPAVLVHDGSQADLPPGPTPVTIAELLATPTTGADTPPPHRDSAAYVIFTSGSTGNPKGVCNTHGALANRLRWMQHAYPIGADDAVLQKTPTTFDVSVWELFWPLAVGARLVVARPDGHRDARYLGGVIRSERITVVHFVPSMLRTMLRAGALADTGSLRHVVCSGEALSPAVRSDFHHVSTAELHNLYGPTEAAIDVTAYDCAPDRDRDSVPIGTPISGLSAHVLGPRGELLPDGVVGQLHLGGIGLARGYVGNPALTAERFVADPYGAPGGRLYRTGDLARRRADGLIEFLGRDDGQVALHGFRIELGEVEAAASGVPGAAAVVVVPWVAGTGGAGLTGFVECERGDEAIVLGLVAKAVADALPEYMRPAAWHAVRSLPTLSSGKVDRALLAASATPAATMPRQDEQPHDDAERAVVAAWTRVLGTPPDGLDQNFFGAGGDSILSIELVAALDAVGLSLSTEDIFANPTPRILAKSATAAPRPRTEPLPAFSLAPAASAPPGAQDAYPVSAVLAGLVAESITNPDYRVYTTALTLRGEFDEPRLRTAVSTLLQRHSFLRSSIDLDASAGPLHLVHQTVPNPLVVVDLRDHASPAETFADWLRAQDRVRFDWSRPPLLSVTAHLITDDEFRLTLTEPLLDGWSVTLAMTELLDLYDHGNTSAESVRPDVQPEFLIAEHAAVDDPRARAHWAAVLKDPPIIPVSRDALVGVHRRTVTVAPDTSHALLALAADLGVPVKSVLLACHAQVVALLSGRTEVVTGVMSNNRPEHADGARAIGMFLNTTPLRVRLDGGTRRDLVRAVHAEETTTARYRHYPYVKMLRDNDMAAPLQTMFNYTHFRPYRRRVGGGSLRIEAIEATDQTYHPLTAQFRQDVLTEQIALTVEFTGAVFSEHRTVQVCDLYAAVLEGVARDPDRPLNPLGHMLPAAQAPTARESPDDSDLYAMFARCVAAAPNATALLYDGAETTYRDLEATAAKISAELVHRGVRPGAAVAVRLGRSPSYVAAVLAVLRCGAAYVPIDVAHPPERATTLVALSGAVLTLVAGGRATGPDEVDVATVVDQVAPPPTAVKPDAPAVVVFTSGSSGTPKGVVLSQAAVANRVRWAHEDRPATPDEVFLLRTPIAFVDSVAELFDGLLRGIPTRIAPESAVDPDVLVSLIRDAGVTRVTIVPTLLREILRLERDLAADLARVRLWHLSGEHLTGDLVRELWARVPGAQVRNLYGSCEVCADATVHTVTADVQASVPVGTALPGVTVTVVHEDGGPLPHGAPGEVIVGGVCLAEGYLGDPRLTADRFPPAPHGWGERWFRTGDLGSRRPDGVLELLGRLDRQLNVRGVRVEPAEVEAALAAHPDVLDAVLVQRAVGGRPALVAYVRTTGTSLEPSRIRAFLRERIPEPAMPNFIEHVARWPRLAAGKIDTAALPDPRVTVRSPGSSPADARTDEIAALWAARLGVAHPGPDHELGDLGASSLDVILLAGAMRRRFGVPVTAGDLRENPTTHAQADLIRRLQISPRTSPDLVALSDVSDPAATLVVIPFAGGDAESYRPLAEAARSTGSSLRVLGLSLSGDNDPGAAIATAVQRSTRGPVALLGHCAGAAPALAAALALAAAGSPPAHVFIVADILDSTEPDRPASTPVSQAPDDEVVRWLADTAGLGAELASMTGEERDTLLSAFRADSMRARRILAALLGDPDRRALPCPITVMFAEDDDVVRAHRHLAGRWRLFADQVHVVTTEHGGHYLNRTRPGFLLRHISAALPAVSRR